MSPSIGKELEGSHTSQIHLFSPNACLGAAGKHITNINELKLLEFLIFLTAFQAIPIPIHPGTEKRLNKRTSTPQGVYKYQRESIQIPAPLTLDG